MQNAIQQKTASDLTVDNKNISKPFPKNISNSNSKAHNIKFNSSNNSTISSPRNSRQTFTNLEKEFPAIFKLTFIGFNLSELKKKKRVDNFGKEIKKGGKHKIVFADELPFIKKISNKNIKRKNSFLDKINNNKKEYEIFENNKRSYSFEINKKCVYKNINNIIIQGKEKSKKFNNVHIIDFKSTKEENKLNTYLMKKNMQFVDNDKVSCSCYCSIF